MWKKIMVLMTHFKSLSLQLLSQTQTLMWLQGMMVHFWCHNFM
jgi:hypothetical protein